MTVFVVDDDAPLREALGRLLRSADRVPVLLGSAAEFLGQAIPDSPCCLVLDIQLPGLSGLDLQDELAAAHIQVPIIFISAHGNVPMSVRAMKAGAVEFLVKPVNDGELLTAVTVALDRDARRLQDQQALSAVRARYDTLTAREREVLAEVALGRMNKQIAATLGTSEKTVKVHRGNLTRKMRVRSVAELVRLADRLGVSSPGTG